MFKEGTIHTQKRRGAAGGCQHAAALLASPIAAAGKCLAGETTVSTGPTSGWAHVPASRADAPGLPRQRDRHNSFTRVGAFETMKQRWHSCRGLQVGLRGRGSHFA